MFHCITCMKEVPQSSTRGMYSYFCSSLCEEDFERARKEESHTMPYNSPEEMMKVFEEKITKGIQTMELAENKRIMELAKKRSQPQKKPSLAVGITQQKIIKSSLMYFDTGEFGALPTLPSFDPIQPTDQTPHQWNLITIKRCTVSREEFHFYGGLQAVLAKKGFPIVSPENGDLMISWFDAKEGMAYYELCRVQDQGELMKYMQEKFVQEVEEEGGRAISLE